MEYRRFYMEQQTNGHLTGAVEFVGHRHMWAVVVRHVCRNVAAEPERMANTPGDNLAIFVYAKTMNHSNGETWVT